MNLVTIAYTLPYRFLSSSASLIDFYSSFYLLLNLSSHLHLLLLINRFCFCLLDEQLEHKPDAGYSTHRFILSLLTTYRIFSPIQRCNCFTLHYLLVGLNTIGSHLCNSLCSLWVCQILSVKLLLNPLIDLTFLASSFLQMLSSLTLLSLIYSLFA